MFSTIQSLSLKIQIAMISHNIFCKRLSTLRFLVNLSSLGEQIQSKLFEHVQILCIHCAKQFIIQVCDWLVNIYPVYNSACSDLQNTADVIKQCKQRPGGLTQKFIVILVPAECSSNTTCLMMTMSAFDHTFTDKLYRIQPACYSLRI